MTRGPVLGLTLAFALLLALGCETPLDRAFGRSQREHLALSIENPEAGQEPAAPRLDGVSTEHAVAKERVHETETQEESSGSIINVEIGN